MAKLEGKKILYLITQTKWGGAQKYVIQLASYFNKKNDVTIVVGEKMHQDTFFLEQIKKNNLRLIVLDNLIRDISIVKSFDSLLELRKLLIKEKPNILHVNSSMSGAIGPTAAWLYRFDPLNQPLFVVYTVHGFVFNEVLPRSKTMLYTMIEKYTSGFKNNLITVSNYDKIMGVKKNIAPEQKFVTIHPGLDYATMKFIERSLAQLKFGISANSDYINLVTIASLYSNKGLSHLIDAMAILNTRKRKCKLFIFGTGPDKDSIRAQIQSLNLNETITVKKIPDIWMFLKAFDIYILSSTKEGFPFTLLEAGAASLPIIATKVGGVPEIIDDKKNGLLIEPQNPGAIASAVETLMNNHKNRIHFGQAIKRKVTQEYTLSKTLMSTESLYAKFFRKP